MINVGIIHCGEANFEIFWNSFMINNKNSGPFYSLLFQEQILNHSSENQAENLSFVITYELKPVAIVPLIIERKQKYKMFSAVLSFNTFYGPCISKALGSKFRKKIRSIAFHKIDDLAKKYGASKALISIDPFEYYVEESYYNYLLFYGYMDASISTVLVDLKQSIEKLRAGRRKHYKALINKAYATYKFIVVNKDNPDYKIHEHYRLLHAKASGRITRHKRTFDLQYESLLKGDATLIGVQYNKDILQLDYFDHNNGYVFYSSSADDPDFNESDVVTSHALIWYSIEYFKSKGFKYYELGRQYFYPQFFNNPSEKDINISFFKRGFGGVIIPLFRGIKYYDVELMKTDMNDNLLNLIDGWHIHNVRN